MANIEITLPDATMECGAILLDMDGVLVDSLDIIERHLRDWARLRGLDPQHVVALSPGRTNAELVAEIAPHLDATAEARLLTEREIVDTDGITACPGAAPLVQRLTGQAWAVVTSGHRPVAMSRLTTAGLPIPSVLITADDVIIGKPDPEGYLTAARRLGIPPSDCVVIEDAAAGLRAAHAAGMRAIAIEDGKGGPQAPYDHALESLTLLDVRVTGRVL
ncbi:HAD-IA family hydrolase [Streptomyces sp. NPDC006476]|uniref:HAD-IA family hydrolase n=1 Tax=Streptomyces sp. NPDC006476 TaxID=3157175 RepID=UPI0033B35B33